MASLNDVKLVLGDGVVLETKKTKRKLLLVQTFSFYPVSMVTDRLLLGINERIDEQLDR